MEIKDLKVGQWYHINTINVFVYIVEKLSKDSFVTVTTTTKEVILKDPLGNQNVDIEEWEPYTPNRNDKQDVIRIIFTGEITDEIY